MAKEKKGLSQNIHMTYDNRMVQGIEGIKSKWIDPSLLAQSKQYKILLLSENLSSSRLRNNHGYGLGITSGDISVDTGVDNVL